MTGELTDVFVEWPGLAPDDERSVLEIQETGCFQLHGLHWQESFIAQVGRHRICHYRAPDAESVRIAFRQGSIEVDAVWSGTMIFDADGGLPAGLVLERAFEAPAPAHAEDAVERASRDWLAPLGLTLARAIVPAGHRRILCFCAAPSPLPTAADTWPCRHMAP